MAEMTLKMLLLGQDVSASKSVKGVGRELDKSEKGFKHWGAVAGVAGAAAATAIAKLGADSIKNATNAEQSIGAAQTVFGSYADDVIKKSQKADKALGLSADQYRNSADLIGSLLKNQGVSQDQLAGKTDELVKKGADLAAVFGGPTSDAVEAMGSALKGEFDPLEKYGITLNQSAINTEALTQAGVKNVAAFNKLTPAQQKAAKQQATLALINKQSASASGQFAAQTDTTAERTQIAQAQYANLTAQLGAKLLPVMNTLLSVGSAVLGFLSRYGGIIGPLVVVLGTLGAVIYAIITAQKIWNAVTLAWNIIVSANPIGLIILAIVGLIAVIVIAYKKSETFRAIVQGAFHAVTGAASAAWGWIKGHWPLLLAILTGPIGLAVKWIHDHWGGIVTFFKSIPGKIGKVIGSVTGVLTAPFRSAFNAIADLWNGTVGQLSFHVPDWVPGLGGKGFSMPKLPHLAAGGIVTRPTVALIGEAGPEAVTPLSAGRGRVGGGDTYQITIQGAVDPISTGKQIEKVLVKLRATNGGRALAFQ